MILCFRYSAAARDLWVVSKLLLGVIFMRFRCQVPLNATTIPDPAPFAGATLIFSD